MPGRPFQPGNKLGRGRPRGSRNKKTLFAHELLDDHAEAVVRQALVLALQGDSQMVRSLLGYVLPRPKGLPLKTGPLPIGTITELAQSSEKLMRKVTAGKISVSDAAAMADLMEHRRRIIETEELTNRVQAIERRTEGIE